MKEVQRIVNSVKQLWTYSNPGIHKHVHEQLKIDIQEEPASEHMKIWQALFDGPGSSNKTLFGGPGSSNKTLFEGPG